MGRGPGSKAPTLPELLSTLDALLSGLRQAPDFARPAVDEAPGEALVEEKADAALLQILDRAGWTTASRTRLALAPPDRSGVVAGFDLGGTKLRGAVADLAGGLLAELEEPTAHDHEGAALDQVADMARLLLDRCGLPASALRHCVLGVPGAVAPSGFVSLSPNLRIPADCDLATVLGTRMDTDVTVENDVNLAAFGEAWRGHGRGVGSLAFLSFGTGVGAGLILDGGLVRGATGGAGEVGFLPVGADPFAAARMSTSGAYEDLVSSATIRARDGAGRSVRDIFQRAENGEGRASASVERLARDAALAVAAIGTLFDPAVIVLGGGIGARPGFAYRVAPHARVLAPFQAAIKASGLGPRAGVVGALMLALDAVRRRCLEASPAAALAGCAA